MAINPEALYPGKIAPSSADYPYGQARNITVPGDGTGTPWEAALVNDMFGIFQALLSSAGIVPSGTPDKVGASQYLSAISSICGRTFPTLAAAIAAEDLKEGDKVRTLGRTAIADGGGTNYIVRTVAQAGTPDEVGDHTMANGLVLQLEQIGFIDIAQFGALSGVSSGAAINAALAYASAKSIPFVDNHGSPIIREQVVAVDNVTFRNYGKFVFDSDIPAASFTGAILVSGRSKFKLIGGQYDITYVSFDNNLIHSTGNDRCLFRQLDILDGGIDRYPLGPIRSQNNTRTRYEFIDVDNVQGIAMQTFQDIDCHYIAVTTEGDGDKSLIETNDGNGNIFLACETNSPLNTATSSFSFNDKDSIAALNRTTGGAHGMTIGHAAPYEADGSVVIGNLSDAAATSSFNVQATQYAALVANIGKGSITGLQGTTGSNRCAALGNIVHDMSSIGMRAGEHWAMTGNLAVDIGVSCFRSHGDGYYNVWTGNLALNGGEAGYDWGITVNQKNAILVGNFAGDDRGTPSMAYGFKSLSAQNLWFGNATDGNPTLNQFNGTYTDIPLKDLSDTTQDTTPISDGTTSAAAAAAGAIDIEVNGVTYSVLHK